VPIVYNEEKRQSVDTNTGASLKYFHVHRESAEFLFTIEEKTYMFITSLSFSDHPITKEPHRQLVFSVDGFYYLSEWPEKTVQEIDETIQRQVTYYIGDKVPTDYGPYKPLITSLFKSLKTGGRGDKSKNIIVLDFSKRDEKLR